MLCDNDLLFTGRGGLWFWIYFFYLSKYYELLDTIFLCLRKVSRLIVMKGGEQPMTFLSLPCSSFFFASQKSLSFLHVYHHAITLLLIFSCLHDSIPVQWVAEWLNAGVHTPMYYYYLVSSFGIQPWWKRYLTQMQIIQFLIVLSVQSAVDYIFFWKKEPCYAADAFGAYFGKFVVASYLVLFIVFYIRTYNKPRTPRAPRTKKD
jgi:hypothetical protein